MHEDLHLAQWSEKSSKGSILIKHYLQLTVKMCQICGTQTKPILAEGPTDVYY